MIIKITALLLCAIILIAAPSAKADKPPTGGWGANTGLNIGSSFAWVGGKNAKNAFAPGADVTYALRLNTPLFWWISAGTRLWTNKETPGILPYMETGFSFLFFNLGAGYAQGFGINVPKHSIHGFAGLAIPTWAPQKGHLLFIEPYWRPTFDITPNGHPATHELGVLIKWFFMISP